jgi:hypothetical protein
MPDTIRDESSDTNEPIMRKTRGKRRSLTFKATLVILSANYLTVERPPADHMFYDYEFGQRPAPFYSAAPWMYHEPGWRRAQLHRVIDRVIETKMKSGCSLRALILILLTVHTPFLPVRHGRTRDGRRT